MYTRILELTREMLAALRESDVDRFVRLVAERDAAIAAVPGPPGPEHAATLQELVQVDREVAALAAELRDQSTAVLTQVGAGREALAGYGVISRTAASWFLDKRG